MLTIRYLGKESYYLFLVIQASVQPEMKFRYPSQIKAVSQTSPYEALSVIQALK